MPNYALVCHLGTKSYAAMGVRHPLINLATDLDMVMARTRCLDVLASAAATCAVVGRKNGSLSRRISGDRVQGILRAVACMGARR